MALEKPGKLWEFFSPTLWPPCRKKSGAVKNCILDVPKYRTYIV